MYIISFRMIVSKYLTGSVLKLACNANCKVVSNVPLVFHNVSTCKSSGKITMRILNECLTSVTFAMKGGES